MPKFVIPPWLHYSCTGCGLCCRRAFHIWCPLPDRSRLGEVDWVSHAPHLKGQRLFQPSGNNYNFALTEEGHCVFLLDGAKCLQHKVLGYDGKTLTCKMYPVTLAHSYGKVYGSLLFSCPAVIRGEGLALSEQMPLLRSLLAEMDALFPMPPSTEETAFDATRSLHFRELAQLEDQVVEALDDTDASLSPSLLRRVLWVGHLIDKLESADDGALAPGQFYETLCFYRDQTRDMAENSGIQPLLLGSFERLLLRQMQGLCSGLAQKGLSSKHFWRRQTARLRRVALALRYLAGHGCLPADSECWAMFDESIRDAPDLQNLDFRSVHKVKAHPLPIESERLLLRFIRTRIATRSYFGKEGWELAVLPGIRFVLTLPSLVIWHAKCHALASGRQNLIHHDVEVATMLVEHTFGHMANLSSGTGARALHIVNRAGWPQRALLATLLTNA